MSPDRSARVAELVGFALERLPSMQLADGCFCFEVVRGESEPRGRSMRYTLMVLLGVLRAEAAGREHPLDSSRLKSLVLSELDSLSPGDHGLLLWADARSGNEATRMLIEGLEHSLERAGGFDAIIGMELGLVTNGLLAAHAERPLPRAELLIDRALRQLVDLNRSPSGLLFQAGKGWRRRFPNFATQAYGMLALARAGVVREALPARDAAHKIGDRLLELQRRNGGWPWAFDARRGTVVEPYEVYSVHQDAMAPMALFELSEVTGDARYREAALRGLDWIWGGNELGRSMLDHEQKMLYRSIVRRRPFDRLAIYANTLGSYVGRPPLASYLGPLEINPTDRPYHLGWILEAWCGREHLAEADEGDEPLA